MILLIFLVSSTSALVRKMVHPSNPDLVYVPHTRIKPTAAPVEFEPGAPPGYPSRTTSPPKNNVEVLSATVQSDILHLNSNYTLLENALNNNVTNKNGVVDWFLGIIGVRPQNEDHPQTNSPSLPSSQNLSSPAYESVKKCKNCVCGMTFKHKRIVGGVETQVNEYPWMVALMYNNRFYCGGSLINNKYILTAAHCVNGFSKDRLSATFLDHDRGNSFETQTISRKISRVLRHKFYGTGGSYNNDIAILQLDKEVPVSGLLKPVCLPELGKSFTGKIGIAVGWGATSEHGQVTNRLREVQVPIYSNIDCRKTGYGDRITDNMLCAGYPQGNKDSCQGDSGGPLHFNDGEKHSLVGIVSWGEGCAEPNYPGVYTRVNRYISWIKSNTRDACYC